MFENLTHRLQVVFKQLRGHGKLTEANISEALREVRLALLEADVNFRVVKRFINAVRERAVGTDVLQSLTPGQQVIKIVYDELTRLMGEEHTKLSLSPVAPTIIMLVGLQGSGKTTSCGKLARRYLKDRHNPLLIAADVYRPAAIQQLATIGVQIGVDVFTTEASRNPVDICVEGIERARKQGNDIVIIDTAGRLHIDEPLMQELRTINNRVHASEVLLVADAMTGQDAVNIASRFDNDLGITGVILTKLDGDARGGAAISIRAVTGKPIKLVGMGEKLDPLESFHPQRMASRILGMGDVLSLIEKAESTISKEEAEDLRRKIEEESFTLEDFRKQLKQIQSMGPLDQLLSMIPGMEKLGNLKEMTPEEGDLKRIEAIISSMTPEERFHPRLLNSSRRKRIARGSGTSVMEVNRLLKQFQQTRQMMKGFAKRGKFKGLGRRMFQAF